MNSQLELVNVKEFQENGFAGPIQFCSSSRAELWRQEFFNVIGQSSDNPKPANMNLSAFHHDHKWAYDICTNETILNNISAILKSENIVLWAMHFWYKEPGNNKYIPWHQDKNYWPMEPVINATAWVSLGVSNANNGCLRLVPGSHTQDYEHVKLDDKSAFGEGIKNVDENNALDIEMQPGEAVFFNEGTIHGSKANTSSMARVACSIRYTVPSVRFQIDEWTGDKERIKTFLVKGKDEYGYNDNIIGKIP
jgi:ectoine hydroxylase-related dioxygenase (phytanoyl-CoA dioxygenase family)